MSDISELFARNPLSFTKEGGEVATIIAEMRKKRAQFNLGNKTAGSTKPLTGKQKEVLSLADKLNLDLDL